MTAPHPSFLLLLFSKKKKMDQMMPTLVITKYINSILIQLPRGPECRPGIPHQSRTPLVRIKRLVLFCSTRSSRRIRMSMSTTCTCCSTHASIQRLDHGLAFVRHLLQFKSVKLTHRAICSKGFGIHSGPTRSF